MADCIGQQLGNYRLVALLGEGGYAQVYLGQHMRLTLQAAIKVLHTHLTKQEAEHFQQEAEMIVQLAHPSMVRILDYDVQDGLPFLVMEYAPGGSLRKLHPKGTQLPLQTAVAYVTQVAAALQYAHEHQVIHRDVKPENMLVGRQQEVLLSDFGLAALAHSTASLSAQGAVGTVAYMAPEQIEGHPRAASDQYALGVVVYEWLCGARPFEGSMTEVMVQHLTMPPPPLRVRVPTLSAEVERVVLQALAKDPKARFASVQDFALALEEACKAESSSGQTVLMLSSGPLATPRQTARHNLPSHLTTLIGREHERATACTLLRRPEVRLVTLTGTGGIGKTRLAVHIATEVLADFPDGVFFVSLAPISDPALVMPTIAQTFTLRETADQPPLEHLKSYLREKHLLLLLDNFEQVLEAAVLLRELLQACPSLKMVVTSRFVLHVSGEHEFAVPPLALPDLTQLPEIEALPQYAAVALFLQRSRAIKPEFQLTDTNARAVAEICVRLDGLPLAIELATARIKLLPPQTLLERLGRRLALLTSGARDVPVRQQTLRSTIQWSYDLLDAREQHLFRLLSVFVGGCTLEAIESIGTALSSGADVEWVLDCVSSLIDKSLLQQKEIEVGKQQELRLLLLETIREYGLEVLAASGELEAAQQAHALYYLALAEQAEPHLKGAEQSRWLGRLEQEHENLRAVLSWLLERTRMEEGKHLAEWALRLCAALCSFWFNRGYLREGQIFLEQALATQEGGAPIRAKALDAAADLAFSQGDIEQAEALSKESLALFRQQGDTVGVASSLSNLGSCARLRCQYATARSQLEEAAVLFKEVGGTWRRGQCLTELARLFTTHGEYDRARPLLEESLEIYRALGIQERIGWVLYLQAQVLFLSGGDPATAQSLAEQSLPLIKEGGNIWHFALPLTLLGQIFLQQHESVRARELCEESLATVKELGEKSITYELLLSLARVVAYQGDLVRAQHLYRKSLALSRAAIDLNQLLAPCLEGLAAVVAAQGEPAWAVRLWGAAEALREALGTPLPPIERADYERAITTVRTHLGEQAFTTAWTEGRTMTPEQALAAQGPVTLPPPLPTAPASTPRAQPAATYPAGLTPREVEVLHLLAQGLTDAQIAEQLVISPRTVNNHLTSIYGKIRVSSRSTATRYAIEHKLV